MKQSLANKCMTRILLLFISLFIGISCLGEERGVIVVNNVQSLTSSQLKEGCIVKTLGYNEPGDGGGNEFMIVSASLSDNGGTTIKLRNGNYAKSVLDIDKIDIRHFGATNNANAHSDAIFRKYVEWCKTNRDYIVKLPAMVLSLYDTYVFEPNEAGKNIKLIGEHHIEHRYNREIRLDEHLGTHSGTVIYSHAKDGIFFDIQNTDLYAGVVIENVAFYGNNHLTLALRIVSGGQEVKLSDVDICNFYGGAIHFNNVYDGYITNLTIKDCAKYYDNKQHPALRFYADRKDAKLGLNKPTNTNALHFTNFHFEHCDCFALFEKCADIFFVNGKMESMAGEDENYKQDPIKSSEPFIDFTNDGGLVSFNSVFFKTPSTSRMLLSAPEMSVEQLPYFIRINTRSRGFVTFDNCMFLSFTGGGMPICCDSPMSHCTISNSIFRYITTGRIAIKANQMTIMGCTICLENEGALFIDGHPANNAISKRTKGKPIVVGNDCLILSNKFLLGNPTTGGSVHTNYQIDAVDVVGDNNVIENNMFQFVDDKGPGIPVSLQ